MTKNKWIPVLGDEDEVEAWECPECHELWVFMEDAPEENRFNYCPRCGKRLIEDLNIGITPGPWHFDGASRISAGAEVIAAIFHRNSTVLQDLANARAIEQVPDMVKWIMEMREAIIEGNSDVISVLLTKGRAILQHIDGEEDFK